MSLSTTFQDGRITPSLLAMSIALALFPQLSQAASKSEDTIIVEGSADSSSDTQEQDYSVKTTTTGTKLLLVPRDIPQSVSVISQQRMQDQNLQTISQVLSNTTGVTARQVDSQRTTFFSRGFFVANYAYDDMPTYVSDVWDFGDTTGDTAIYDRIEVVRGAAGLMSGTGNPSAYVNMVRKHADSREFQGNVIASYGSWDNQRYIMDLQSPLTNSGNIRGRVIAGYQDNDSWLDRNGTRKKFIYGVVDADITDSTLLSLGYDYQEINIDSPTWGGLPTWWADGSRTNFNRSDSTAPDWAYSDKDTTKVFANLTQRFDNGWEGHVNAMHTESNFDTKMVYLSGFPNKATGAGSYAYGGWNRGERKLDSVDAFMRGGFELFGRQHEMMFGGSYSRQRNHYDNSLPDTGLPWGMIPISGYYDNIADPNWTPFSLYSRDTIRQKSAYTSARFSLADPLHLIVGARYTWWSSTYNPYGNVSTTFNSDQHDLTPYAGLIYDINDTWSAYASYTSIFQPTEKRDIDGKYLDPTKGKSYEAGVKADWFNTRLTTSLAVFRIEQDNVAESLGVQVSGNPTETAYRSVDGTVSKGVEFELNGALTDNWQLTFGASRFIADDQDGNAVNPDQPRTTMKLFTRYKLPIEPDISIGGGVNWQNKTWWNTKGPTGQDRVEQGSYALVDLFTRYQVTKNFAIQANVNNLFDKEYYDWASAYLVYGEPRNFSITASYQF
ncbi:ferric-rhodotorulic acid/ferric-coprogen receptor FhuE [Klebsiella spallanzanii]|uniref:FhuE receptor n=1 Tax=Klebsiella spallanzanii TaxID=2587528 RepID=A0A564H5U9_9ENTR|nr:FhuE receptor [Klebsiella spallanzanii]